MTEKRVRSMLGEKTLAPKKNMTGGLRVEGNGHQRLTVLRSLSNQPFQWLPQWHLLVYAVHRVAMTAWQIVQLMVRPLTFRPDGS